jgi:ABC-type methionine transport system permease subunit
VSLLWLAVLVVFARAWVNFNEAVTSPSLALQVGQALPYVALAGTVGAGVVVVLAWREGYWTAPLRLHYTLVTLLAFLFAWQLSLLGILPL